MNGAVELVKALGPARLAAMGAITLALIGFFAFVIMRVSEPSMGVLYADLSSRDASAIIRDLESRGVVYETRGDGQTVLVPRSEISRLRMDFAGKGLPVGGGVGYEIFDKGDAFSATSFVQGINHLRALEGELSRSISSISRVNAARVHLVMPERRLFERDREGPRASIVLTLAGELEPGQIRAVRHLVATAVEGLKPERISIIDERGRLLADGAQGDMQQAVAFDEKQVGYERRLRSQIEEIVAGIVGVGRSRVQVAAELDVNRIESRSETFDPEGRVVRSTQTRTEKAQTSDAQQGVTVGNELPAAAANQNANAAQRDASEKEEETVNYEISKTMRTEVTESGRVKRLSVAVLVDGIYPRNAAGETSYQPRPQEELDRIAALVRSAIGFDSARGDQIEVVNLRFAEPPATASLPEAGLMETLFAFSREDILRIAELGILALLTLIVLLMVVRPLVRQIVGPQPASKTKTALPAPSEPNVIFEPAQDTIRARESNAQRMLDIARVNGQVQAQSVERIGELVRNNPQETVAVLRQWIHEGA